MSSPRGRDLRARNYSLREQIYSYEDASGRLVSYSSLTGLGKGSRCCAGEVRAKNCLASGNRTTDTVELMQQLSTPSLHRRRTASLCFSQDLNHLGSETCIVTR